MKSGNTNTPSLNWFVEHFSSEDAIKLIDGNVGVTEKKNLITAFFCYVFVRKLSTFNFLCVLL